MAEQAVQAGPGTRGAELANLLSVVPLYAGAVAGRDESTVPQTVVGSALVLLALPLFVWTRRTFRSWKLSADIAPGHELVTTGPFALVRHPLYATLALVGLATLIWAPNVLTATGFVTGVVSGQIRAMYEERTLTAAFGDVSRVRSANEAFDSVDLLAINRTVPIDPLSCRPWH